MASSLPMKGTEPTTKTQHCATGEITLVVCVACGTKKTTSSSRNNFTICKSKHPQYNTENQQQLCEDTVQNLKDILEIPSLL